MPFHLESSKNGKAAVLLLSGSLDAVSVQHLESACEQHLSDGMRYFVLDMTSLEYVSSMGIRSFIVIGRKAKAQGGAVLLCGMKGFVKDVLDMTHVTSLFPLFDSTEAAIASL